MKECPELEKEGFRIDKVLAKSLIQAKHYRIKCEVTSKFLIFILCDVVTYCTWCHTDCAFICIQLKSGIKNGASSTVSAEQSKRNPQKIKEEEIGKKMV